MCCQHNKTLSSNYSEKPKKFRANQSCSVYETLDDNEALLKAIFDGIQEGIIVVDRSLRILRANNKLEQWFAPQRPIVGKYCYQVISGLNKSCTSCPVLRTFQVGTPQSQVMPIYDREGKKIWIEIYAFPLSEVNSKVNKVVSCIRDITTRRQLEEELRAQREHLEVLFKEQTKKLIESEERFRSSFEYAPTGIGLLSCNGHWFKVNAAFCQIVGYSEQELINLNIKDITHPDDFKKCQELMQQILEGNIDSFQIEKRYLHKSGHEIWVHVGVSQVQGPLNQPLYFIVHVQDITKRKQAERNLRLSEERFSKAFHSSPNMMFISSIKNGVLYEVNKSFEKVTGYTREEVIGKSILELNICQKSDALRLYHELINKNNSVRNFEAELRDKNGNIRYTLVSAEIIELNGSKCILGVVSDLTEMKLYERKMARLERLNIIGEMAASISHEVRNPLTTVRGFLQILAMKKDCQQYHSYYQLMLEELDRANDIITEFLSIGRIKASELVMQNLNSIVKNLTPLIKADALNTNKKVEIYLGDVCDLPLDGKEIRQVILNLARNGLEAMKPGGKLTIKTYMENDEVVLEVKDQGKGMSLEVQQKLGTPFFTTKEQGTGLGLATCYSIAERHNARITYQTGSTGTTFYVRFRNSEWCNSL